MQQTISITVSGQVQGVFYRQSACSKAMEFGITGFVQNLADGSVRIVASGTEEKLKELIAWCRQGPPKAQVSTVQVQPAPARDFEGFHIRRF
jgi:acylphosphatase